MVDMVWRGPSKTDAEDDTCRVSPLRSNDGAVETGSAPLLLLMAGFAGAGKTTLARLLCEQFECAMINKDDLKLERLARGNWSAMDEAARTIFIERAGWEAFEELLRLTREALLEKKSVIIDTSNEKPAIFDDIMELLALLREGEYPVQPHLLIILCTATRETREQRLEQRGSVFKPYVHELPDVLDDSKLSERFSHLLQEKNLLYVDTELPLQIYANHVLDLVQTYLSQSTSI